MKEVTLREAQVLMTTILRDFDKICRENSLNYWVDYGTLLGTIRHKGFIPWDDDIDVGMLRDDYNKFLKIASEKLPTDLYYQDILTDDGVEYQWAKIRHKGSIILEEANPKYRSGMFIDIFPYDYYESEKNSDLEKEKSDYIKIYKIIYNANLNYEKSIAKNSRRFFCKCIKKFVLKKELKDLVKAARAKQSQIPKGKRFIGMGLEVVDTSIINKYDNIFPVKKLHFENIEVSVPNNYHTYLCNIYGDDYMEIPSEEKRYNHSAKLFIESIRQ